MSTTIVGLAFVVAVVAAARSTWSPCGQSMLSQITPIGEASRGHRYPITATWYVVGGVAGGATLGALIALLAWGVHALAPSTTTRSVLAALVALAGGLVDSRLLGVGPPFLLRQVNEYWLHRYRAYVYALGFGWQIGVGITTYIMTAAVFATILLGALGASPWAGFAVGVWFGFVRGMTVWITARATTQPKLFALHRRFDALGEPFRQGVTIVQLVVAAVALGFAFGVVGVVAGAVVALVVAVPVVRGRAPAASRAVPVGQPARS